MCLTARAHMHLLGLPQRGHCSMLHEGAVEVCFNVPCVAVAHPTGGWAWFQELLTTLRGIADKHNSSIANVATR